MTRMGIAVGMAIFLSACATGSKKIEPIYVSPLAYQSYDCGQIAAEQHRVLARVDQVSGRMDKDASKDKKLAALAFVTYGVAAAFMEGDNEKQQDELARLRGEYEALQQAAILKKCPDATTQQEARQQ